MTVVLHPPRDGPTRLELNDGAVVEDAVRAMGLLPDGWIAVRGNNPIPSDEPLTDGEELRLISVVSGG